MSNMEESKSSPKKTSRSLTAQYSSYLLHETAAEEKLHGLTIASCNPGQTERIQNSGESNIAEDQVQLLPERLVVPDVMTCSCCQVSFVDREEQLSHYKSDWHRYNLHQRLKGLSFVTEEKFEDIAGDVSSISGSDDDDDEKQSSVAINESTLQEDSTGALSYNPKERKFHKVFFSNDQGELISIYRCLLHHKKNPVTDPAELMKTASQLPKQMKWIVLMVSAGHFAGAVFHGKQVVEHKTFHRYTVRAKRGSAQSSKDKQGSMMNSAGARLRRYNEAALAQEVQELLTNWAEHFRTSNLIFVRIPTNNRAMFYGGRNPVLKKEDQRIRVIPFATRRPTFSEAKRVYQMLASVECYGQDADVGSVAPLSPPRFYSTETDQLEVREPKPPKAVTSAKAQSDSTDKTRSTSAGRSRPAPSRHQPEEFPDPESSSDADPDHVTDAQLVEHMQTVDLSHLKEFECTAKRKHGKKKKERVKDSQVETDSTVLDEDRIRWRNRLFTACKTGDMESLLSVLSDLNTSQTSPDNQTEPTTCTASPQRQHPSDSNVISPQSPATPPDPPASSVEHVQDQTAEISLISGKSDAQVQDTESGSASTAVPVPDLTAEMLRCPVGDSRMTFLHLAAREGHAEIVTTLLTSGADPTVKDGLGKLAYNMAETEVRNAFRRFMAAFPERYDYAKAQIPSPLTPEMENEKKIKMAEKRKQKKKAAQERNKEKKAAEAQIKAETREKDRFLALSDREKRALAAERRILHQHNEQGTSKPVLSRCYQCGEDISGKIPFEYSDFKFCATRCLREHRAKPAS